MAVGCIAQQLHGDRGKGQVGVEEDIVVAGGKVGGGEGVAGIVGVQRGPNIAPTGFAQPCNHRTFGRGVEVTGKDVGFSGKQWGDAV